VPSRYKVEYEDGDAQEYNDEELAPLLLPDEPEVQGQKPAQKGKDTRSAGQKRKSRS
jgi:hypothetical protein